MWFFASFILFTFVVAHQIRRHSHLQKRAEDNFWKNERDANSVRKQSLDDLDYIQIPLDRLPISIMADNEIVSECLDTLHQLSEKPIVNLTGYSNTDLKLTYGAPNLTVLTDYDQRYTLLVRTLQKWADTLYKAGWQKETREILEFAVETRTDISKSYFTLAEIYQENGDIQHIQKLLTAARALNSAQKNSIVRKLTESYPGIG